LLTLQHISRALNRWFALYTPCHGLFTGISWPGAWQDYPRAASCFPETEEAHMKSIIDATYGEAYLTAVGVNASGRRAAASRTVGRPYFRRRITRVWTALVAALVQAEYRFPPDYFLGP
jgi:hypothetical protein